MLLIALVLENWGFFPAVLMVEITLSSSYITSMQTALRRRFFSCTVLLYYFTEIKNYKNEVKYKPEHK